MTIDKWKSEENKVDLRDWCMKVKQELKEYHTDKQHIGYLSMDEFFDDLFVAVENSELRIGLNENLHETTDARNSNILVINYFVDDELPYYSFDRKIDSPDADYGFVLIYKLKEGF